MSMKLSLSLIFDLELFNTEELAQAQQLAMESSGVLYCWKTTCSSNWLEKGLSRVDVLGIVVLPRGLPDYIEMPDDIDEDED